MLNRRNLDLNPDYRYTYRLEKLSSKVPRCIKFPLRKSGLEIRRRIRGAGRISARHREIIKGRVNRSERSRLTFAVIAAIINRAGEQLSARMHGT